MKKILILIVLSLFVKYSICMEVQISESEYLLFEVPENFEIKIIEPHLPDSFNGGRMTDGEIGFNYYNIPLSKININKRGGISVFFEVMLKDFPETSVEGKINPINLKNGLGVYSIFTDKTRTDPRKKYKGGWDMAIVGVIQGEEGLLSFTVYTNSIESRNYQEIMYMIEHSRIKNL